MAYQPIEPVGLGRNVSAEMMKGGPRLQEEIKTMGPNTIKMIALQQIADQQKQKASQANLQAQTNPATVVQQLEQQLGGMGQPQQSMGLPPMRDKAQQVGGALAQKQQQQQKNMQRAAQGQGRPPMMAGGGLLSVPAPNIDPRYFEGGGIVAFELGGRVQALVEEYRKNTYGARNLSDEEILALLEKDRPTEVAEYRKKVYGAANKSDAEIEQAIKESFSGRLEADRTADFSDRGRAPDPMSMGLGLGMGMGSPTLEPLATERMEYTGPVDPTLPKVQAESDSSSKKGVGVGVEEVKEEVEVDVPKVSATGIDIPQSLKDAGQRPSTDKITQGLGALKTAGVDGEAAARTDYRKQMQLDPELKEEMNTMARRTKEREENYKPSRATTIREALAGAANRGSLGSVGAGISGAMSAREGDIQKRKDSLFKARQDSLDKLVTRSDDIAKGALAYGADARKGFKADARTLVDAEVAMYSTQSSDARQARQQEADIVIANAGQKFKAEVENVRSTLKAQSDADLASYRKESNAIAREGNAASKESSRATLINNINKGKAKTQTDIAAVIAERAAALDSIEAEASIPEDIRDDPAEVAKWKKKILDAMAKQYAPMLDAYDAQLKDLGIDVPEPAAPTEQKASPTFASLPK